MKYWLRFLPYLFVAVVFSANAASSEVEFFRAINVDDDRTVRSLLANGFDPNTLNDRGQPALFVAMRDEAPKVAALLVAHAGIRIDGATSADETPLMMAALRGNKAWVERLLAQGAALNRPGWTPLHYACSSAEGAGVVGLLLERGSAVDAASPNRSTPLMMASRYGSDAAVDALLARGADARLRNERGLSAADFARLGGREALAKRLDGLATR